MWKAISNKSKYTTDIPSNVTTPDEVETRIGNLRFFDGLPDKETINDEGQCH